MQVDDETYSAINRIFPLLPWAIEQMRNGIDPGIFLDLEPGTRAGLTNNLVMRQGQRVFSESADISVAESQGLLYFVLPSSKLRVKRGNPRSLSIATNHTTQSLQWTYQLSLEGMASPEDYLHMVYVPDTFWTRIDRCVVGVYKGKMPRSWFEIDVDDWYGQGHAPVEPFTFEPEVPELKLKPGVTPLPLEEINGEP